MPEQPTALLCRCRLPRPQNPGHSSGSGGSAGTRLLPLPSTLPVPRATYRVPCTMCHVLYHVLWVACHALHATRCAMCCTLHAVHCAMCRVPCATYHVPYAMYCAMCCVPYAMHHVPRAVWCMLHAMHCAMLCHVPCTARRALCHTAAVCSALSTARYLLHQTPGAVRRVPAAYCHVLCDTVPCVLHPPCVAVLVPADAPGAVTSTGAGCHPKPSQGLKLGPGAAVTGQGSPKTLPGGCHQAGLLDQGCRHHPGCQHRDASLSRSGQPLTRPLGWPR